MPFVGIENRCGTTRLENQMATMRNMRADVAQSVGDVLVDKHGDLWIRRNGQWAYVTEYTASNGGRQVGPTEWDTRTTLPENFAPYNELDPVSAEFVIRAANAIKA